MDINLLKKLREETEAGVGLCKEALEKSDWNYEEALKYVDKHNTEKVAKKSVKGTKAGVFDVYAHGQSHNIAVITEVECQTDFVSRNEAFREFAHEVSLQVAAMSPEYVSREDVPADAMEQLRQEYAADESLANKPENIKGKIVEGKIEKYLSQACLMEQPYFRDTDKTMKQLVEEAISKFGENIKITRFIRWQR